MLLFKKKYIPAFFILALLISLGGTIYSTQFRQDIRQRANFEGLGYHQPTQLFTGTLTSELGVENNGNVYAPEVMYENGLYKMWYGGQNQNSGPDASKDRIHYAESTDGVNWNKLGIALEYSNPPAINGGVASNHINDATVVKVGTTYYMYYTDAWTAENDRISMATSSSGRTWKKVKMIIDGGTNVWSNKKVGRPSVMYQNNQFHMWYDAVSKSPSWTGRYIAHAWSNNGSDWATDPNPMHDNGTNAPLIGGAVDVKKLGDTYFIVLERGEGVQMAYSKDGINWGSACDYPACIWIQKVGQSFDRYGHITPFLFIPTDTTMTPAVYFGGARNGSWSSNVIGITKLQFSDFTKYANVEPVGNFDHANCEVLAGYACDMNAGDSPIDVHIYDGTTFVTAVSTTYDRKNDPFYTGAGGQSSQQIEQQLSRGCSPTGNVNKVIGWKITTPNVLKNGQPHTLHAYAINTPAGANKKLTYYYSPTDYASTTSFTLTCAAPTATPIPTRIPPPTDTPIPTLIPTSTPILPTKVPTVTPVQPTATPRPPTPTNTSAVATPIYLRSDFGGLGGAKDNKVDIQDFNILAGEFYKTGTTLKSNLINTGLSTDKVDIQDYNAFVGDYQAYLAR